MVRLRGVLFYDETERIPAVLKLIVYIILSSTYANCVIWLLVHAIVYPQDMNEPAAFDTNKDKPWNWDSQRPGEPDWNLKCDMSNTFENPPYKTSELPTRCLPAATGRITATNLVRHHWEKKYTDYKSV